MIDHRQHLYDDPGVGTLPEPGAWTRLGRATSIGSAWRRADAKSGFLGESEKIFLDSAPFLDTKYPSTEMVRRPRGPKDSPQSLPSPRPISWRNAS